MNLNKVLLFILLFAFCVVVSNSTIRQVEFYKLTITSLVIAAILTPLVSMAWAYYRNWRKNYNIDKIMKNINKLNK